MRPRYLSAVCTSLLIVAISGCDAAAVSRTAPAEEEHFARAYVRVLRDSGVAAVQPRTKTTTRALPQFQVSMETLRGVLAASPRDTLVLTTWEVVHESNQPKATRLVYSVADARTPFEVELWIEREAGQLAAETIRLGPSNP